MGWGYQHTPFYVPDPRDPYDLAETAVSHAAWGFASWSLAYALTGSNPGPGHLGTLYRAFLSRAHLGAAYAGTNAFDDTMFALRTYARPITVPIGYVAPALPLLAGAAVVLGGSAYIAHKIQTDPSWQSRAQELGRNMDFSFHFA